MTRNCDCRTPKERISPSFRQSLENDYNKDQTVGIFFHDYRSEIQNSNYEFDGDKGCKRCGGADISYTGECTPLAMIYSPHQDFENMYDCEDALHHGSLFKDLEFPFRAACCGMKEGIR